MAKTWAFQCVYFGAELVWPGDVVRLLNADLVDLIGPPGAVKPGEDRAFFLRVAILYKAPESDSLKIGGEVWTLDEDERDGSPKVNGVNGSATPEERSPAPVTNGKDSSTSPKASNGTPPAAAAARPPQPADLPQHMPRPPAGCTWQLLTAPGTQAHFDLDFLAGRVHPLPAAINARERIREVRASWELLPLGLRVGHGASRAASVGEEEELVEEDDGELALSLNDEQRSLVLAGLKPAVRVYTQVRPSPPSRLLALQPSAVAYSLNCTQAGQWRPTRQDAVLEAEKLASVRPPPPLSLSPLSSSLCSRSLSRSRR